MSKINVLESYIFNRIAAGEVVERPYSVVKELIENSVDAGSSHIDIYINGGGTTRIRVSDNGCGIEKDDLKKAFLPHATSKIGSLEDLEKIETLGFRGEALASIGSVAKVRIVSAAEGGNPGYEISCDGGVISEISESASPKGTSVTVDSLFYNTPARAKFLKTERSEEGDITNIVARSILANPGISFKYYADNELIYQSFGGGLEDAVLAVYGKEAIDNSFYIQTEKHGVEISGYLGKIDYTKPNRTYQTVILNGRYIQNSTVTSAVANAYSQYLMKRNYPFYVLELRLPIAVVDVNVHPNKTDVRFSNNQVVYGAVYSVLSSVLDGTINAIDIVKNAPSDNPLPKAPPPEEPANQVTNIQKNDKNSDSKWDVHLSDYNAEKKADIFLENKRYLESLEKRRMDVRDVGPSKVVEQAVLSIQQDLRHAGVLFRTFLIFEGKGEIILIDQHAAHERMIYDELKEKLASKSLAVQPMLVPYVAELNSVESNLIRDKLSYIREIGIEIEEFGRTAFKISALPAVLMDLSFSDFFNELLEDFNGLKKDTAADILKEKLMQTACKSAVKAGDALTEKDRDTILSKLKENPGLRCPHGRPVKVNISKAEIEKWFKRIV